MPHVGAWLEFPLPAAHFDDFVKRKPSLFIIFLSVFIDLIGFGIVLPLLPKYSEIFGARGAQIGLIIASYSVMQFLFAPAWGRLSDRIGRRPVILISNAGSTISYVLFAVASNMSGQTGLWILVGSRIFAGICGANLSVASAYIADVSPPEKRSAKMGLIGMAFGLGFIFGPVIGAASYKYLGLTGPGLVAAGFCGFNFLLGCFILGESRHPGGERASSRPGLNQWAHTLRQPKLGLLIGIFFLATFCFSCFESTLILLLEDDFGAERAIVVAGYLFTFCGVVSAIIQGGLIGRLVKLFGEPKLIFGSLLIVAASLAIVPSETHMVGLIIVLGLFAGGSGVNRPPVFGLISLNSSRHEQGANLGVAQSAGSLARILAPPFATHFYPGSLSTPYYICSGIAFVACILVWTFLCRDKPAAVEADVQQAG